MAATAAAPTVTPDAVAEPPCGTASDAVRAFGVVFGGAAVLDGLAAASVLATGRALKARRRIPRAALVGTLATAVYAGAVVPWMRSWGSTADEVDRPLPGDELVPDPGAQTTRTVEIDAPVHEVWPWLAQIGQDRGGFYSYAWLENLAGCQMVNAEFPHDEWLHRQVGDLLPLHPNHGVRVARFEPEHALVLDGWGAFVVEPLSATRTRLTVRGRSPRGLSTLFYALLVEIPHFVMERKMLLGIKDRAERAVTAR